MENEIPRHIGSKKYKKRIVPLFARYVGNSYIGRDLFNKGQWFVWKRYRDARTAEEAKRSLTKKWKRWQFRVEPTKED